MLGIVRDAAVAIDGDRIAWVGEQRGRTRRASRVRGSTPAGQPRFPGFVDSHTHLVFAGDRTAEFDARMRGEHYAAGGIQTTVAATRAASDDELRANAARLRDEALRTGTTHVEVKSGYGLDVDDEARLLTLAGELTDDMTFLGGHVVPPEFAGRGRRLRRPGARPDARCLRAVRPMGGRLLRARRLRRGPVARDPHRGEGQGPRSAGPRQPARSPARARDSPPSSARRAPTTSPISTDGDAEALADAGVVATLVPVADLSTRSPWPDAAGIARRRASTVALATDCNPGTSFTTNMPIVVALAVTAMRMTPAEAVWSATAGGARALQRDDVGTLQPGARADLVVLDAPSYVHLAYRPGVPLVRTVIAAGDRVARLTSVSFAEPTEGDAVSTQMLNDRDVRCVERREGQGEPRRR